MNALARFIFSTNHCIERVCRLIAYVSMALIFVVLAVNVFVRYLKLGSFKLGAEVPEAAFPWLVASCVALAAIHGAHISVQFLSERVGKDSLKWMRTAMSLVAIALYVLTAYIVIDLLPIVKDDKSPILKMSLGWTYAAMLVAFVAIVVAQFAELMRAWGFLDTRQHVPMAQISS